MPSSLVLPEYVTPVASFITRMSAPVIIPFEGSTTRPLIVPLVDCAARGRASDTAQAKRKAMRGKRTRTVILQWPTDSDILFRSTERGLTWYHSFLKLSWKRAEARKDATAIKELRMIWVHSKVSKKEGFAARLAAAAIGLDRNEHGINLC